MERKIGFLMAGVLVVVVALGIYYAH